MRSSSATTRETELVLIGLQTGGVWIAARLARVIGEVTGHEVVVGTLDVAFYRDDYGLRPVLPEATTEIPVDLRGRTVVLVDDVLFTGRTIRAALGALNDYGRARAVQLAVMVDRGHRELPDPAGLRGPQPADPARRDGRRERGRAWSSATCGPDDPRIYCRSTTSAPTGSRRSCTSPTALSK